MLQLMLMLTNFVKGDKTQNTPYVNQHCISGTVCVLSFHKVRTVAETQWPECSDRCDQFVFHQVGPYSQRKLFWPSKASCDTWSFHDIPLVVKITYFTSKIQLIEWMMFGSLC